MTLLCIRTIVNTLTHRNETGESSEKINLTSRKVYMKAQTEHKNNIQKSANLGMETFLNWQKQTIENTFSMLDQGIATQEDNLAKTRTIVKEWENNLNQVWGSQKEEFKSIAMKFSEALWPESKKQVEQVEKFYQDNFGGTANKTLEMLENSIDRSIESNLSFEKIWVSQLRENYTCGTENLRKQMTALSSIS